MVNRFARSFWLFAVLAISPLPAAGQPSQSQAQLIDALRGGSHVIVFRHGATYQDQADTDPLNPAMSPGNVSSMTTVACSRNPSGIHCTNSGSP